jgi:hypothetical protein
MGRPPQYGSIASRRPSPSALNAKTVISTKPTGERIQGIGADHAEGAGVLQHQAPGDQRRLHREAEKAEEALQEHDRRNAEGDRHDHVAHHVRQDVPGDDPPVAGAHRHRRAHVVDPRHRHGLRAHLARELRPAEADDDEHDEAEEEARGRGDRDERRERQVEGQLREGEDDLDEPLEPHVELSADVARRDAGQRADQRDQGDRGECDRERDARADDAAGEDVAAELVGAENVQRGAVGEADEVTVHRDQAEEAPVPAPGEEA